METRNDMRKVDDRWNNKEAFVNITCAIGKRHGMAQ